jgi:hypothetical protein
MTTTYSNLKDRQAYTLVVATEDVTEEIIEEVMDIIDGWYDGGDRKLDWEDIWDNRLDGAYLKDGSRVDLGGEYDSPAMRKIQRECRKIIKYGG